MKPTLLFSLVMVMAASMYAVSATEFSFVCDRTPQVRDQISESLGKECSAIGEEDLRSITDLNLSGLGITELQRNDFQGLSNIDGIDLSYNELKTLPEGLFQDLTKLLGVNLSHNQLVYLPEQVFFGLSSLQGVDLSDNQLSKLPENTVDNSEVVADFSNNPWIIDPMALTQSCPRE